MSSSTFSGAFWGSFLGGNRNVQSVLFFVLIILCLPLIFWIAIIHPIGAEYSTELGFSSSLGSGFATGLVVLVFLIFANIFRNFSTLTKAIIYYGHIYPISYLFAEKGGEIREFYHHVLTHDYSQMILGIFAVFFLLKVVTYLMSLDYSSLKTTKKDKSLVYREEVYKGEKRDGKREGKGELTFNYGDKYIGKFEDNLPHGYGKYLYTNGDVFEGNFVKGSKEGEGTLFFPEGGYAKGVWQENIQQGEFIYYEIDPRGGRYEYNPSKAFKVDFVDGGARTFKEIDSSIK